MNGADLRRLGQSGLWSNGGSWEIEWESTPLGGLSEGSDGGAWVYQPSPGVDSAEYNPLAVRPPIYLAFARLGHMVWAAYQGRFLSESELEPDLPETLRPEVKRFLDAYGPPVNPFRPGGLTLKRRSLHFVLRHAQLIDLAVHYQRVMTAEEHDSSLREEIRAVRETLINEEASLPRPPEQWGLDTHEGVAEAAQTLIGFVQHSNFALGGIQLTAEGYDSPDSVDVSWKFVLAFDHLLNIIWYQVTRAMVLKSLVRICRNPRCRNPGGMFEAARTNQWYCTARCRTVHNTWLSRHPSNTAHLPAIFS